LRFLVPFSGPPLKNLRRLTDDFVDGNRTDERSTNMTKLRRLMLSLGAVAAFLMAAGAGFKNY
jgi:hypothetical protein